MKKHVFKSLEKFAIWESHECKCFWDGEPVTYRETTIDHVIPESLIDDPAELERIKLFYKLPQNFSINDFCNWVPAHSNCNNRKSKRLFDYSPAMIYALDMLILKSGVTSKLYNKLLKRQKRDKVLGKLLADLESEAITNDDLIELLKQTKSIYSWRFPNIDKRKQLFVPEGWHAISENKANHWLDVTNGKITATVPSIENPDDTWLCHTCNNYGPWVGNRCVNCGTWGDID